MIVICVIYYLMNNQSWCVMATWFKHHANNSQFSFTESGTCKYRGESGELSTCEPWG